ncbi:homoserine O-acetyltransferase [Corynebacterium sp. CCM 9185]|uniref:Homoserine O-acetyltransferase n=1 Tax=Corynebacterium marambiense TaxID=2765364 RepID=A0ABS0VVM2_9CORY|nr:homoserine O-acetyltransferase [Corynebacterium marambiense]MBI8999382.1 homoserine O-acetyltransferase [Corynebacterium marambiense]MCK7662222.1 homoserine O-acetyltransferase [Corynebacterium marambiense]
MNTQPSKQLISPSQSFPFPEEGKAEIFPVGDIRTEAGGVVWDARIAVQRWGELRRDTDGSTNIILVEHALTGDSDAVNWWNGLIGPGLSLDTDRYCVMCTNALGGCSGTTGPSSPHPDGRPWGSRFPALSIRDLVTAERQLLDVLGISKVTAVVGGSMGGARTLEWILMHPERVGAAAILAVSARASAWQIGIQSAQISAITNDPEWLNGEYHSTSGYPRQGLAAARRIAHLTYRGEQEIDERFGTDAQDGENPLGVFRDPGQRFAVQSYLDHQARKLVERFDAGSYVVLTEALNRHDIGRGRGGLNKALSEIQVPTLVAGVDTDILYPYHQQEHISRNVGNLLGMAKIVSPVGHDAFLTETRQVARVFRRFLLLATGANPA